MKRCLEFTAMIVAATAVVLADSGTTTEPQGTTIERADTAVPLAPTTDERPGAPPDVIPPPAPPAAQPPGTAPGDDVGSLALLLVAAAAVALAAWVIPRMGGGPKGTLRNAPEVSFMDGERFEDGTADANRAAPSPPVVEAPPVQPVPPPPAAAVLGTIPAPPPPTAPSAVAPAAASTEIAVRPPALETAPVFQPVRPVAVPPAEIVRPGPAPAPVQQFAAPVAAPATGEAGPGTVAAIRETRESHSHQSWGSFNRDALPRLLFYGGNKFCQFSADRLEAADEWFVIGDIHGDFYALHAIVSFIRKTCPGFGIVFLGDLIDRGPHPIECLWYLLKIADDHPNRVLWLAGNHDVGVRFDEAAGTFRSTVEPAEFVSDLNVVDSFAPLRRAFGREYIELSQGLPRAAVMPDGLLLTHGGFPHSDLQEEFAAIALASDRRKWLESDPVIRDFTHLRITRYPLRRPNRLSISCSYGYKDFESFRRTMTGYNVKRLVTGHQHAATGYDDHPDWAKNGQEALTLTGFGFADAYDRRDAYLANYRRTLVAGRCRPDRLPEIVPIPVDERDLAEFFDAEIATMPRFAAT